MARETDWPMRCSNCYLLVVPEELDVAMVDAMGPGWRTQAHSASMAYRVPHEWRDLPRWNQPPRVRPEISAVAEALESQVHRVWLAGDRVARQRVTMEGLWVGEEGAASVQAMLRALDPEQPSIYKNRSAVLDPSLERLLSEAANLPPYRGWMCGGGPYQGRAWFVPYEQQDAAMVENWLALQRGKRLAVVVYG